MGTICRIGMIGVFFTILLYVQGQIPRTYDMDELATCGRTLNVDDSGVRLNGRGNTSPSQPPLTCIVYLQSVYASDDGSNKLQIEVELLQIRDCNVVVNLYNGRNSVGRTLQSLSCQYSSTGIFYATNREVTVVLTRPDKLVHNEYQFALLIKPFKDRDIPGTTRGVSKLSVGGIIGIIIGCLLLIALIILFLWCFCTGRLGNLNIPGRSFVRRKENEKSNAEIMKVKDPITWDNGQETTNAPRLYERNAPRVNPRRYEHQERGAYVNDADGVYVNDSGRSRWSRGPQHDYEPYDVEPQKEKVQKSHTKETLIDDVFDSDSATARDDGMDATLDSSVNAETLQKRPVDREKRTDRPDHKTKNHNDKPESSDLEDKVLGLEGHRSTDLQSQPDTDTISSPHHVNSGIRASVEDIEASPNASLNRKRKHEQKSPKSKRKGGKEPDQTAMPPEAFDPIFTAPITGIDYKGSQPALAQGYGMPQGYPGYMPYGMVPTGMFAPTAPGTQTYAYAYQTVPPGGVPGQQGAWVVQNTPTADGNRRTAYVMQENPGQHGSREGHHGSSTPENKRRNGRHHHDAHGRTPYRDQDRTHKGGKGREGTGPDLSLVARGLAPPDPGQGHRSVAMKSGTDPNSGIHTTQVVWTDTAPDRSDPKPGENPQVTRKTVTRVTTKSGYGDLPPESNPLMMLDNAEEPDFLSPSKGRLQGTDSQQPAFLAAPGAPNMAAATRSPSRENIDFYTGPGRGVNHKDVAPPDRTSTPDIPIHKHAPYHSAIRDRIPFDDSTV